MHPLFEMKSALPCALALAASLALGGCNRPSETPTPTTSTASAPAAGAQADVNPYAGVVPSPSDSTAVAPGKNPGEGSTAIGGVVAGQDKNKPEDHGAPEPSGGDAATTKPAAAPSK